jgi:quinoprotein glucose dehydrogenase
MTSHSFRTKFATAVLCTAAGVGVLGQQGRGSAAPPAADWPMHNRDIHSTRYSPLDEINASNVNRLAVSWSYQLPGGGAGGTIASTTPLVVDGLMYFNAGSQLFALDGATGKELWTFQADPAFRGSGRGPVYADGRIYAFGNSDLYAVDAKTGKPVQSFGQGGVVPIVRNALRLKYPGKYAEDLDPTTLGYSMTTPPSYFNGTLYLGMPFSDSLLPGGLVVAVDGVTGAIKWVFNTVPQGPQDDGWDITKDSFSGARYGAGIWVQPAIDPELGLIYVNTGNATPNYDGSSRKGMNLFTNSLLALRLDTGRLAWYFQAIHHDIWDWDLAAGPVLFDTTLGGRSVKGVGSLGKNCQAYFLDRETGKPLNPIVETVVPTQTDVPGEQVWPTQPVPYTSSGQPLLPFCSTYPIVKDPELAKRVRPSYHPYQVNEFVITAPGNTGGSNYGSPSFSPRTGLFYATGKNDAWSIKVKPVGDSLKPGPGNQGHFAMIAERGETGITPTQSVAAYEPATGRQVWYAELPGTNNGGSLVTAGDVVFQPSGQDLFALDARSGKELFRSSLKRGIRASPLTYQAGGRQYVAIVATNTVAALALP